MNKLKISILLMLYDAGEKGLTDKQIADRLDINKKGTTLPTRRACAG